MNIPCLTIFLSFLFSATGALVAAELTGKVTGVTGDTVMVVIEGTLAPVDGDSAIIFFKLPGTDEEVMVATGKISKGTGVAAVKVATTKGKVQKGQLVRITSKNAESKPVMGTMTTVPLQDGPVPSPPPTGSPAESQPPPRLGRLLISDNFDKTKTYKENPKVTVEALNGELRIISKAISTVPLLTFYMRETRDFYAEFAFRAEPDVSNGLFGVLFRSSATGEAAGSGVFFRPQRHSMKVVSTTGKKTVTDNTAPIAADLFEPTKRTKVGVEVSEKRVRVFFNDKFAGSLEYEPTEQSAAFGIYATTGDDAHPYTTYYDDLRIYALAASPKAEGTDKTETGQATAPGTPSSGGSESSSAIWYRCNEGSGNTVADSGGHNLPLQLHGGLTFTTGQQGNALYFPDSKTVFASRDADDEIFNFGDRDFMIELQCRFDAFQHEQVLIEKFSGKSGPGWTLTLLDRTKLHFFTQGSGAFTAPVRLQPNQWHRIAVFRRGPRLRMFVDQSRVLDQPIRGTIIPSTNPLLLGKRNDEDGRGFPLNGAIDDVRIETAAGNSAGNDSPTAPSGNQTQQQPAGSGESSSIASQSMQNDTSDSGVFRGRYTVGFETSAFEPCGKQERWWLEGNLSAMNAKLEKKPRGTMQTLFVRLAGTVSPPGRYGHLGRYQRKFSVQRVISARAIRAGDCE